MKERSASRSRPFTLREGRHSLGPPSFAIPFVLHILFVLNPLVDISRDALADTYFSEQQIEFALQTRGRRVDSFTCSEDCPEEKKIAEEIFYPGQGGQKVDPNVALVDLNLDGRKDIFYSLVDAGYWCGAGGYCPKGFLIREGDDEWKGLFSGQRKGAIFILPTRHNGFLDLRVSQTDSDFEIWWFDGAEYSCFLQHDRDNKGGVEVVSTHICDPPLIENPAAPTTVRCRLLDKR